MAEASRAHLKRKQGKTLIEASKFDRSNHSRAKFDERTGNRAVGVERIWNYDFLKDVVKFAYLENFEEWGWWPLLASDRDILSNAVKVFYFYGDENAYNDKGKKVGLYKDSFVTKVFDVEISITPSKVNRMLGIEHVSGPTKIPTNFDFVEACKVVYDDPNITTFVGDVKKLNVHNRLLLLMFTHTLFPKKGGHADISKEEIFLMYQVIVGNPPNLGEFIAQKMVNNVAYCRSVKNNFTLPYGRTVSTIIERLVENIPREELREVKKGTRRLDESDLKNMKFKLDPLTELWVRDRATEEEEEVQRQEEEEEVTNRMLMQTMTEGFARINAWQDSVDTWRGEVDMWRGNVDARLKSMEDFQYGRRFDGSGPSGGDMGNDTMDL